MIDTEQTRIESAFLQEAIPAAQYDEAKDVASSESINRQIGEETVSARARTEAGRRLAAAPFDVAVATVFVLMLIVGFTRLDRFPAPWFDEGIHLQVAKNLINDGTYAARSADGTLDYAPSIGVGPTLLLPVAASLEVFGTTLSAARTVPVIYLVVSSILLFMITRKLFGDIAAMATLAILLTMPALDWAETGRQVLGELPALTFLLLGGILVKRATTKRSLFAGSLVLGLSLVTKGQYVLIVPATLLALTAVDTVWTKSRPIRWHVTVFASVIGTWVAWIITLLLVIGDGNVIENVRVLRNTSSGALLVFNLDRMQAAWGVVLGPSSFVIVLPAMIAGALAIRSAEDDRRFGILALWLFQAVWLGWFVSASIGWPRYAFPGLAVNAIFGGYLISRLLQTARPIAQHGSRWKMSALVSAACCVALVLAMAAGGWRTLVPIGRADERDAERFSAIMNQTIPADAVVDGWEPELGFLTNRKIQPPPPGSLNDVVKVQWLGGTTPDYSTDLTGEFLFIGPFGRWVGVYQSASLSEDWQRIAVVGQYELYQRQH